MHNDVMRIYHRTASPEDCHRGLRHVLATETSAVVSEETAERWIAYDSEIMPDEVMNALLQRLADSEYDWDDAWRSLDQAIRGFGAYQYDCQTVQ